MLPFRVTSPAQRRTIQQPHRRVRAPRIHFFLFNNFQVPPSQASICIPFSFCTLQVPLSANPLFSQPSALPGCHLSPIRFSYFEFRFSRKSRAFSRLRALCRRLSSPVLCFQQLTHSFRKYWGEYGSVEPKIFGPLFVSGETTIQGATRSKMAPSTLDSHRGVTK